MPRTKPELQERLLQVKQQMIVEVVNRLLAQRGYDAMTVDAVASEVGVSKASLYKLYPSKETLAGAAMIEVIGRANNLAEELANNAALNCMAKIEEITRWAISTKLEGQMPSLPSGNDNLSRALQNNETYMDGLLALSMRLGSWISEAQNEALIRKDLNADFILYNLYARACDPVIDVMKQTGHYPMKTIENMIISAHFEGLQQK